MQSNPFLTSSLRAPLPAGVEAGAVWEGDCTVIGAKVAREAYAGYLTGIRARDRYRVQQFMRATLAGYAAESDDCREPKIPKAFVMSLVASCVESMARIQESAEHAVGEARAALVRAFEILAAFLLILLGLPVPPVTNAPGTIAAVQPVPALGIPANHVAQLVAAGPIRAS